MQIKTAELMVLKGATRFPGVKKPVRKGETILLSEGMAERLATRFPKKYRIVAKTKQDKKT